MIPYKKCILALVLVTFIYPVHSVSQVQGSFFPLQIGNSWKMLDWDSGFWGEYVYYTHYVSDSVIINNKTFYRVNMHVDRFFREDSTGLFYEYRNGKEFILFDFNMTIGDSIPVDSGFCYCMDRKTVTTFTGAIDEEIHFYVDWSTDFIDEEHEYTFQKNVGLLKYKSGWHSTEILKQVILNGKVYDDPTSVTDKKQTGLPLSPELSIYNYPNPFNNRTKIEFNLPRNGFTDINIYNTIGQKTENLVFEILHSGKHDITWDARQYPSGMYFIAIQFENQFKVLDITLVK